MRATKLRIKSGTRILACGILVICAATIAAGRSSAEPANTIVPQHSPETTIDWSKFSVGNNETVTYFQPGATALKVDRVLFGRSETADIPSAVLNRQRLRFIVPPPALIDADEVKISGATMQPLRIAPSFETLSQSVDRAINLQGVVDADVLVRGGNGGAALVAPGLNR